MPVTDSVFRFVSSVSRGTLMEPREFISLAIRLSRSQREADLRSAISRAYYGAFHVACEFLESCGIQLSGKVLHGADVHKKVRFCLRESGDFDAAKAAEKLGSLRDKRNHADYDLKGPEFDGRTVALQLRITQEIVDVVDRCRQGPTFAAIRDNMKVYARDVLRVPVRDV